MQQPDCAVCGGTRVVMVPPMEQPQPCLTCIAEGRIGQPEGHPGTEFCTMDAINTAVVVRQPEHVNIPASTAMNSGIVLVGPGHVPGVGGVVRVVLIAPTGEKLALTMAAQGLAQFSGLINRTARALQSGAFDLPAQGGAQ